MIRPLRIIACRWRIHRAARLIDRSRKLRERGLRIIQDEERRWGLAPVPGWRVPDTP